MGQPKKRVEQTGRLGDEFPTVRLLRLHVAWRALAVTALIAAWLAATNHCALGLMTAAPTRAHCAACKPERSTPVPGGARAMECCKAIQGAPAPERVEATPAPSLPAVLVWLDQPVLGVRTPALARVVLDHGPPSAPPGVVAILRRSFFSHAPPLSGLIGRFLPFDGSVVAGV